MIVDRTEYALAQLRHLYQQLLTGAIVDQREAARGLLGPAIEHFEQTISEHAGTPVADRPGHAHASGGGHARPGEIPAAGNVADPQDGPAGSDALARLRRVAEGES